MQIPLIHKNPSRSDLNCVDGEIDFNIRLVKSVALPVNTPVPEASVAKWSDLARRVRFSFVPAAMAPWTMTDTEYPETVVRIPLKPGERSKAEALLSGDASRVDADTAERLTAEIGKRLADVLADLAKDAADAGLFLTPLRAYTQIRFPDGSEGYPSAGAVLLPFDSPPHPEFVASSATDDTMTIAVRFPLRFFRLEVVRPAGLPDDCGLSVYVSDPMPLPDSGTCKGSIGSVRSVSGSSVSGYRFSSLSAASMKAYVSSPDAYHLLSKGRISPASAPEPDWSHHCPVLSGSGFCIGDTGIVLAPGFGPYPVFPQDAFFPVESTFDPSEWMADWISVGDGFMPSAISSDWRSGGVRPDMMLASCPGNSEIYPAARRHKVGTGSLLSVAEALRPVSSGQLGEFPVYVFSTEGVWAMKADAKAGYVPSQKIGRHRLAAPHLVCPYLDGVAFITVHGLYGIEGNRIQLLSSALKAGDGADEMSIVYDEIGNRLVINTSSGIVYHEFGGISGSGSDSSASDISGFGIMDITDLEQVWPEGMDMEFVKDMLETDGYICCLMTRPMCLGGDSASCRRAVPVSVRRLQVCGLRPDGPPVSAVLFGSRDGASYQPLRRFDPRVSSIVRTFPYLRYRLLLTSPSPLPGPLMLRIN